MEAPNITEWGPALWRILHTFAERVGKRGSSEGHQHEYELWMALLGVLSESMPCSSCQSHYSGYKHANPYTDAFAIDGGEPRRVAVRTWLWTLHNNIRTRKGQNTILSLEAIPFIYASYVPSTLDADCKMVLSHMARAAYLRIIRQDVMGRFTTIINNMRKFYD